jgi:hypothetical protein
LRRAHHFVRHALWWARLAALRAAKPFPTLRTAPVLAYRLQAESQIAVDRTRRITSFDVEPSATDDGDTRGNNFEIWRAPWIAGMC